MVRSVRLNDKSETYIKEIQEYIKLKIGIELNISDIIRISIIHYHNILKIKNDKLDNK